MMRLKPLFGAVGGLFGHALLWAFTRPAELAALAAENDPGVEEVAALWD